MKYSVLHHVQESGRFELGLRYCVYLPCGYSQEKKRYNTLYLLHGAGDDEYGWACKGFVQQILNEMNWEASIVVMPLGFLKRAEMVGWYPPVRDEFEAFWFEELVPSIECNYRVYPESRHQAIAGLSLGAEQALDLAWGGRGAYVALGCLSPVFCLEPVTFDHSFQNMVKQRWPALGEHNKALLPELFYLACADRDHLSTETSRKLAEFLRGPLVAEEILFVNDLDTSGFHEWSFWRYGLKCFLHNLEKMWSVDTNKGE